MKRLTRWKPFKIWLWKTKRPKLCHFMVVRTPVSNVVCFIGFYPFHLTESFLLLTISGKTFDQHARLMVHSRNHQTQNCPVCNETFAGRLDRHMREHHNIVEPQSAQPAPSIDHTADKTYDCTICDRKFKLEKFLEKHIESHQQQFFCDICKDGRDHKMKQRLKKHKANVHGKGPKKQRLTIEGSQLEYVREAKEEKLKKLQQVTADPQASSNDLDSNQPALVCSVCGKECLTKKQFTAHMSRHDQSKQCPICGKSCPQLNRHMNSHMNVKKHVCHICGSAYTQLGSLKEHIEAKHLPEVEFYCDICNDGKNFQTRSYLKRHLDKIHAKLGKPRVVPTKCKECDEQFASNYALRKHNFVKHKGGSTLFPCEFCDKTFAVKR